MRRRVMTVLAMVGAAALVAAAAMFALAVPSWRGPAAAGALLFAAGFALIALPFVRVIRFRRKLERFMRHLLTGNYDVGMTVSKGWRDELTGLEWAMDTFGEQLRAYDRLRAERVQINQRIVDVILGGVDRPIMVVDIDRDSVQCNGALRGLYGLTQRELSLGAMEKLDANRDFVALLRAASDTEKQSREGRAMVQFPAQESLRELELRLVPIKDRQELVRFVVVFAAPAAGSA